MVSLRPILVVTVALLGLGAASARAEGDLDRVKHGIILMQENHSFDDYCVKPDLNHEWLGSHLEANFANPRNTLAASPNDGFVRVNDATEQRDILGETATEDETMGFYTQEDLPFYYALAETFAINDRYFSPVLGPTFPNRAYALAATSFGHLDTFEQFPPPGGYKPITGTILDLLDQGGVFWVNYFSDAPSTGSFRPFLSEHLRPITQFFDDAA